MYSTQLLSLIVFMKHCGMVYWYTTLCPDKKWTPKTLSIIALYGCGSLKKLNEQYCSAIFKEMRKLLH